MSSLQRLSRRIISSAAIETLEGRRLLSGAREIVPDAGVHGLPRGLTPAEEEYLKEHPIDSTSRVPSSPPTGPIDPVAEYDPMEGLVVSWTDFTSTLGSIAKRVTDAGGRMYIGVLNVAVQTTATNTLEGLDVNMDNVTFFTTPYDSVWARDYGPRYVYEGDVRVITDHVYNRQRPNDDNEPINYSAFKKHPLYQIGTGNIQLIHGGGNFHLASDGDAYATQLIVNENNPPKTTTSLSATQIQQIWKTYENDNVTITQPFPTSVDSTQHIDMWMQIYGDKKVFISDWPNNVNSTQDQICDSTATLMQSRGYQVTRLPAYSIGGTHFTFANMVLFNNIVLLPTYTNNATVTSASATALAAVQAAMPGKQVFTINANSIVTASGVFHCIVQHVPVEKGAPGANGGLAPVAYLRGPNTATTFTPGQSVSLQWITDDDGVVSATAGVQSVDIMLSTDGGQTFPTTIAANQAANGSFNWTVPANLNTTQGRIRVVARDGQNNTGFDDSDANFTVRPNGYWTGTGDGATWANANNWSNNTLPTNAMDVVLDVPGATTINITGAVSVRSIVSNESLSVSGAGASLTLAQASSFASGATLTFSNGATLNGAGSLAISGALALDGAGILSGGGSLSISTGATMNVTSAGTYRIARSLTIDGTANVATGGDKLLRLTTLSIGAAGKLDLNDNDLVASSTPMSTIESYVSAAYNFGDWQGVAGIFSTTAKNNALANTTLGVLDGQQFNDNNGGTFDGYAPTATDVLVKYTYFGDVDFNGSVDVSDYNLIDFGFVNHATGWANGDADYSGGVDASDYNVIDFAFATQNGVL